MAKRINRTEIKGGWRDGIQAGNIINRLNKCVSGEIEMTAVQVNAAKIILGKILPDLKSTDTNVTGNITTTQLPPTSPEQLAAIDAALNDKY